MHTGALSATLYRTRTAPAMAQGDWKRAYALLSANSDFPEFTSRICPALCEASCVHGLDEESVMVRQSEKRIIETAFENGWVVPCPLERENGKSAAAMWAASRSRPWNGNSRPKADP